MQNSTAKWPWRFPTWTTCTTSWTLQTTAAGSKCQNQNQTNYVPHCLPGPHSKLDSDNSAQHYYAMLMSPDALANASAEPAAPPPLPPTHPFWFCWPTVNTGQQLWGVSVSTTFGLSGSGDRCDREGQVPLRSRHSVAPSAWPLPRVRPRLENCKVAGHTSIRHTGIRESRCQ